ncbi:SHOCT domain-containing protein [Frankia sp. CNm7]|uniref:SHOCT domain-containing protein n=1 Tax=Frankia nepalensis TaxID=1836974 RepID=A0A937UVU5_9ACTN|nr:SHOCT domain-containing protein [Frankia nepalensis]MBL7495946.1 SHOCT domain-containing protein [Frankia nepalensis]MBL7513581.1 SHOCT domain-containing protein [Frankia nepalensis]MBL7524037.1 SHOCT domain-containing protein [Frankia nepalensis]MBL7632671.1 SHOCT domain-containing protein [Frankia nepalensis]
MDYPFLGAFLTMLWFFLFAAWMYLLFVVVSDVFQSRDLSGWSKAGWVAGVIVLPLLGVLLYLAFRGEGMRERSTEAARRREAAYQGFRPSAVQSRAVADELTKLADLRKQGEITDAEYQQEKSRILT